MANKKVELQNLNGDNLYPKTFGDIVVQSDGTTLWAAQGAQVNVLEGVQVNGTDLTITNKKVNVVIPSATVYSIVKQQTAEAGYAATYNLTANGTATGASINIPKDMVVQSGSVVEIFFDSSDNTLHEGSISGTDVTTAIVGSGTATASDAGAYIKLVIANASSTAIYIKVTDLVDLYTAGNGIDITSNAVSTKLASGSGLVFDNSGNITISLGNGLEISSGSIRVKAGTAIQVDSNGVSVKYSGGLEVPSSGSDAGKLVLKLGNGLQINGSGELTPKLAAGSSSAPQYLEVTSSGFNLTSTAITAIKTGVVYVEIP